MANYNGSLFVADAVSSVLADKVHLLELIVVDDASTDCSLDLLQTLADKDPRLRLIRCKVNAGPAAARNRGLEAARGDWVAIVDSDDLVHPSRLAGLLAAADRTAADIVADDLMVFDHDRFVPPTLLLGWGKPRVIDLETFVQSNSLNDGRANLGLLKPIIRASVVARLGLRYDETLRNAEDADLINHLLANGCRMLVVPEPWYLYRKHGASISHRLSASKLQAMSQALMRFREKYTLSRPVLSAIGHVLGTYSKATTLVMLLDTLKHRDRAAFVREVRSNPLGLLELRHPAFDRLKRVGLRFASTLRPRAGSADCSSSKTGARQLHLLTRQRIVGHTNGSSVYLLSLLRSLRDNGFEINLLCPSPAMFGRWPWLKLQPEMAVFKTITARKAIRFGQIVIAGDPRIWISALTAVTGKLLLRCGIRMEAWLKPAPFNVAVPWLPEDRLFVAAHSPGRADSILCDYAYLTEGIPYLLNRRAPSAVVQHDLFHTRAAQFTTEGATDSVSTLDAQTEWAMLAQADAVIAIQPQEADKTRAALPGHRVMVAPMAIEPVGLPQPGTEATVLFIGSNTAPNVQGLAWLLDAVWPLIRTAAPDATLMVAGSVCGQIGPPPPGVRLLGLVDDLGGLYRDAAVVVSPLRIGSGLKIKLVEALGHGKAIVATSVTMQGVEDIAGRAVIVADEAAGFAGAVLDLLAGPARRAELAAQALAVARAHFSADACYGEVVAFLAGKPMPIVDAETPPQLL